MTDIVYIVESTAVIAGSCVAGGLFGTAAFFTFQRVARHIDAAVERDYAKKHPGYNGSHPRPS